MKKKYRIYCLLFSSVILMANSETGCRAIINDNSVGCSESNIFEKSEKNSLMATAKESIIKNKTINITEKIVSVEVLHDTQSIVIERIPIKEKNSCPPFCIEPMQIKNVVTVGEVETLAFIEKLKEKKSRLLVDVRENIDYKKSTIPGAINLPLSMLKDKSPYQEEVLRLLGAKKSGRKHLKSKWYFKNPQALLIFGQSATTSEASTVVKRLLEFGYPSSKIFYYRGGVESWEAMGLTLF